MNFLVLISAISSLLSITIIPVGTKSINDNTNSRCYYYKSDLFHPNNISEIIAGLNNNNQTRKCLKSQPCGSIISSNPSNWKDFYSRHHRIPRRISVILGCMSECLFMQNSLYQDHTDYDIPHGTHTRECCQGDLCNTLDNLPNTNNFLNSPARNMDAHNEKCPNYSANYQVIWLDNIFKRNQDFIIESGSNLLLSNHHYTKKIIHENKKYNGTLWLVTRTNDPSSNDVPIIEFSKTGDDYYDERSQDYIAKNKIFFVTADVMHICNFTDAEGNLTIKHVDIVDGAHLPKLVNIIVKSSTTSPTTESIIPTTTPTTTNEQTDYPTTAKNTEFYTMSKSITSTINNTYYGNNKTNLFKDSESADNSWKLPVIIIVPTLTAVTIIAIAIYKKYGTYFHNNKNDKKNNLLENQYSDINL